MSRKITFMFIALGLALVLIDVHVCCYTMDKDMQLICKKQYSAYLKYSERFNETKSCICKWEKENNALLCKLKKGALGPKETNFAFIGLLNEIQGVNLCVETMLIEVCVIYNIILTEVMDSTKKANCWKFKELFDKHLKVLFKRLQDAYNMPSGRHDELSKNSSKLCSIASYFKKGNLHKELLIMVVLACIYCIILCSNDMPSEALHILTNISDASQTLDLGAELGRTIVVEPLQYTKHSSYSLSLIEMVSISCFLKKQHLSSCISSLDNYAKYDGMINLSCIKGYIMYQQENFNGCISILMSTLKYENISSATKAFVHNLLGNCLAKQLKPNSAIQHYSLSLQEDFSQLVSLYNISLQYRALHKPDAELESLNLLLSSLEKDDRPTQKKVYFQFLPDINLTKLSSSSIGIMEALYILARRCLDLQRYDISAKKYIKLINHIQNETFLGEKKENCVLSIPSVKQIFYEAAFSLLKNEEYNSCISLCDELISKQIKTVSNMELENKTRPKAPETCDANLNGKKRSHSIDASHEVDVFNVNGTEVLAFIYKADALIHCGKTDEAFYCLQCAINSMEETDILQCETSKDVTPSEKRRRLSSGLQCAFQSTSLCMTSVLTEAYLNLSTILMSKNDFQGALKNTRLCLLLKPEDLTVTFNHTVCLIKLNRFPEAMSLWLKARKIDLKLDTFQSKLLQKQLESELEANRYENSMENDFLKMDIFCLKKMK